MASLKRLIPNRRLSSKSIQNHLQANIVDEVVRKGLQVITTRLVWKMSKPDLQNAKLLIANKRNFADSIIAKQEDVLFFFSCLSAIQERKRKMQESNTLCSDEDEEDDGLFPLTYPALNYWIVVSAKEEDLEGVLFRALLDSGLDIDELKPIN